MKQYILVLSLAIACLGMGCEKDKNNRNKVARAIMDTSWAYTQEVYLWYKSLPSDIGLNNFTDPNDLMEGIRKYSIEPGFSEPVDRWSFALKKDEWNDISNAITKDFGISIFFNDENDLRVSHCEPGSPAYRAGVRRSWRITGINGNTTINTGDAAIQRIVDAVYNSASVKLDFLKPDNTEETLTLTAEQYP